ncbi:MAG: hypothetical protein QOD54_1900, partial [Sphingomonadales bacterium]|nr:hypothetical protein [Sphingomonadales bacterium]
QALAHLWTNGATITWTALHHNPQHTVLPTYAFDTQRHWIDPPTPSRPADEAPRLYGEVLRQNDGASPAAGADDDVWIVFGDDERSTAHWMRELADLPGRIVTVQPGEMSEAMSSSSYRIRPGRREDYEQLFRAVAAGRPLGTVNVVYLWNAGNADAVQGGLQSLVYLARSLTVAARSRVAVLARGLASAPTQALALGAVRALPLEYSDLRAAVIDVDEETPETSVIEEVRSGLPESYVVFHGDKRSTVALDILPKGTSRQPAQHGVYLVTGAFGGVGSALAEWLARSCAARLVLVTRTPLPDRASWDAQDGLEPSVRARISQVQRLESVGAEVHVESVDVTDEPGLTAAVARAEVRFGAVQGVIHAAGLAGGRMAHLLEGVAMREVVAPKLGGTLALAAVFAGRPLDFFAVMSSTAASLGSIGQVDYCAANAYLDAWARAQPPLHNAVSIAWDAWRQVGMAVHSGAPDANTLAPAAAVRAFQDALGTGAPHVIVATGTFPSRYRRGGVPPEKPASARPRARTRAEVEGVLTGIWQNLLGGAAVDINANFFDLGGDSLLMIEAGRQIKEQLDTTLAVGDLFKHPTIAALARELSSDVTPALARATSTATGGDCVDIAVIGMACHFPGAESVEDFWRMLVDGVEALVPTGEAPRDPGPGGRRFVPVTGDFSGADRFDAAMFGYSPREAELMDPQQRLLLTCAYESLEDAGYDPRNYPGHVGVYVGASMSSYLLDNLAPHRDSSKIDPTLVGIGNEKSFVATNLSYRLNLTGPSVSVSTACSTSLVAIAQACRTLAAGECDAAVAGGVNVRLPERSGYWAQPGAIASPDGHCRAFDADAQGTLFTSGVGVVVLKRLSDAVRDGDVIRAVVRGSAVNNDGSDKVGFTAPSVRGQARVVFEALQTAGVDAESIGYVEAHGTATPLGDPIEVAALTEAFRATTPKQGFCALGSVKTNIGHLDTAAGIAGFIKAVLCVQRGVIPASLHFRSPNPRIDFASSPFFVNTETRPWTSDSPRRAGVSSFGMGGTNAHVILEQPPAPEPATADNSGPQVLVISAKTAASLAAQRDRLATYLATADDTALRDAAFTLQTGRGEYDHRAAVVGRTTAECRQALTGNNLIQAVARPDRRIAFLFAGQGTQTTGMARTLIDEPVFGAVVRECAELLEDINLLDLLTGDDPLLQTQLQQPALFVMQYAMARQLQRWGVQPSAMVGHSLGEYVAATLAGVWTLPDALRLIRARGELMQQQPPGAMVAVSLPEDQAQRYTGNGCVIAAVNGPEQTVLSGPNDAITDVCTALKTQRVAHRRLATSHAFHSPMLEPMREQFEALVTATPAQAPHTPFTSNVTGTWITDEQATSPAYWAAHTTATVRYADCINTLLHDEPTALILETGPGATARTLAAMHPNATTHTFISALPNPHQALAHLWTNGATITWTALHHNPQHTVLPTYAFDTQRHWIDPP